MIITYPGIPPGTPTQCRNPQKHSKDVKSTFGRERFIAHFLQKTKLEKKTHQAIIDTFFRQQILANWMLPLLFGCFQK